VPECGAFLVPSYRIWTQVSLYPCKFTVCSSAAYSRHCGCSKSFSHAITARSNMTIVHLLCLAQHRPWELIRRQ